MNSSQVSTSQTYSYSLADEYPTLHARDVVRYRPSEIKFCEYCGRSFLRLIHPGPSTAKAKFCLEHSSKEDRAFIHPCPAPERSEPRQVLSPRVNRAVALACEALSGTVQLPDLEPVSLVDDHPRIRRPRKRRPDVELGKVPNVDWKGRTQTRLTSPAGCASKKRFSAAEAKKVAKHMRSRGKAVESYRCNIKTGGAHWHVAAPGPLRVKY